MPETNAPHISLKRDAKGRIAERTLNLNGRPETRRYGYDSAGRLTQVTDATGALLESYSYDHQARRMADIRPESQPGERRFTYGPGDRLAAAGNTQYGHDRAGFRNLKVQGSPGLGGAETWYHYEPSGLLLAVDLPGGNRIEYAYDSHGLRREKRLVGRLVAVYDWLDPLRLSEFYDGREWWRFAYLDDQTGGRTPVGVTNGRDSFLLLADQLGTPLALATIAGRIVQIMRYDSFGNLLERRGAVVDLPLGFAGGLFDPDTGLTRFVWRDYDAETGRFTALDPLREKGGDTDFYGYCVDDPVNRVDVWGLFALPMPGPLPLPVPPVFIPGTPDNDRFTRGTLDILNGAGEFLREVFGGSEEVDDDPNTYEAEHTSNQTPSNLNKHEEGQARNQRDKGGEKKDKHPDWKPNPNKKRSDLDTSSGEGLAWTRGDYDTEDEA